MNKISKKSVLAVSVAILGLLWIFAVASYTIVFELPWLCWGSIVCVGVAIIAAEVYLLAFRKDSGEQGTEPGVIGIILTICFLVIAVLLNSIFVLWGCGDFNWILLSVNLILMACYIVLLLWVEMSAARLSRQLLRTEQKTTPSKEISRKLGELLALTEDSEIKGKLLSLKQSVDYSTNISTMASAVKETQMSELLDDIAQLSLGHADRLIILNKIDTADKMWKMRNSITSSVR